MLLTAPKKPQQFKSYLLHFLNAVDWVPRQLINPLPPEEMEKKLRRVWYLCIKKQGFCWKTLKLSAKTLQSKLHQ